MGWDRVDKWEMERRGWLSTILNNEVCYNSNPVVMKHQLRREQQLHCDLKTAWQFFSTPLNLAKITPADMRFTVLSTNTEVPIYEGMIIAYKVSPLWGIPLFWQTKITQVNWEESFTDYQEKGPYRYWNHLHEFIPNADGVLMRDTVEYELPFGILGEWAHTLFVKKKLEHIFDFRYDILEKKFNQ